MTNLFIHFLSLKYFRLTFVCTAFVLFANLQTTAQISNDKVFTVLDTLTQNAIPFVLLFTKSGNFLADGQGKYSLKIKDGSLIKVRLSHPLYRTKEIVIGTKSLPQITYLERKFPFLPERITHSDARRLMENVLAQRKFNDPNARRNYTYQTYNKVSLSPGNDEYTTEVMDKIHKKLFRVPAANRPHHLLLLETATERKVLTKVMQQETIVAARATEVVPPLLAIEISQLRRVSVYDTWVKLGGREYESPLSEKAIQRYMFTIEDTISLGAVKLVRVKFSPAAEHHFKGLQGYLYLNDKDYAIAHVEAQPEQQPKLPIYMSQSFQLIGGQWFPFQTFTQLGSSNPLDKNAVSGQSFTQVLNVNTRPSLSSGEFDETLLDYPAKADEVRQSYFDSVRTVQLTPKDSATYDYYSSLGKINFVKKSLRLGENLYFGFFPVGKVNFLMNRFLDFNRVERIRLGVGLETNGKFSTVNKFGMFVGYGIKDRQWKYGLQYRRLLQERYGFKFVSTYTHELEETGLPTFSFHRNQYPSESLRDFTLQLMDMVTEFKNEVLLHPVNFLDVSLGAAVSRRVNFYTYNYRDKPITHMDFMEMRLGFRYAFGERNIHYRQYIKVLPSRYPIVYLQLTQAINAGFGEYGFGKIALKVEQYVRLPKLGITQLQLLYTATQGNAPYAQLFNGKGSQQNASVVVHNSFETMLYNEFLADRFLGLFVSHEIGKLYTPYTYIQPTLSLLHNMGIGSLARPEEHTSLPFTFKLMNRGYIESGMFLSNLLVIRVNGLKIGLGAGVMYRYGTNSSLKGTENTVFKFALSFRV